MSGTRTHDPNIIREAREYVNDWRNDDAECPIPLNDFGTDLAHFVDVLIDVADQDHNADYREVFGRDPEPWRAPLGALRLTLNDETVPPWTLERARAECEELVRVLNGVEDKS